MCLVSYIPLKDGFAISSNRDEAPKRNALNLQLKKHKGQSLTYPQDIKGGSWFFASNNKIAVVLNGAFVKHKHQPPYKISRGLMLKAFFDYPLTSQFLKDYEFEGIEAFTSLLYNDGKLIEFRWDGTTKHVEILDTNKSHVYSSSTLYNDEQITKRKAVFNDMLNTSAINFELIKEIHRTGKVGDIAFDFIMNRENRVMTTSISHVIVNNKNLVFEFENLITKEVDSQTIGFDF